MNNITTAEQFIAKIRSEPVLAAKLKVANYKSVSEFSIAVIALAAEHGIALTVADIETWLKANTPPPSAAEGELSDAQLEGVAGGRPVYVYQQQSNP